MSDQQQQRIRQSEQQSGKQKQQPQHIIIHVDISEDDEENEELLNAVRDQVLELDNMTNSPAPEASTIVGEENRHQVRRDERLLKNFRQTPGE